MDMTFRWYGENDPVTLEYISQIPQMSGVVTAIYDVPVGEVWPLERIMSLKEKVNAKKCKAMFNKQSQPQVTHDKIREDSTEQVQSELTPESGRKECNSRSPSFS